MKVYVFKTAFFVNNIMLTNAYKAVLVVADKVSESLFGVCLGHHH